MADTGEDREIKRRVNAHQAEVVRESKQLEQRNKGGRRQKDARRETLKHSPTTKPIVHSQADPETPELQRPKLHYP